MNIQVKSVESREHLDGGLNFSDNGKMKNQPEHKYNEINFPPETSVKLLKQLVIGLINPTSFSLLSHVSEIFHENEVNNSSGKLAECKTLKIIQEWGIKWGQWNLHSNNIDSIVTKQEERNLIATTAIGLVRSELLRDRTEVNYSQSLFNSVKVSAREKEENNNINGVSVHTSYAELWARIASAIQKIKSEYVDFYADLMQKYTEMYEAFNENVQKGSSSAVSAGDDGNNVRFDTSKIDDGYNKFRDQLNDIDLGNVKNWNEMTPEQRASMQTTLEPAFKINGSGKISFNMDQYNTVAFTYPSGIKDGKVSTSSYQAWLATFNAAGTALQSNMQSFAQRYSQANNTFDNLNKVLSGAISSLADSARDVIKSLG